MYTCKFIIPSLSSAQYGFRRNLSTMHTYLSLVHATYASINSKSQTDVIYLDFTVSPTMNLLLVKLWSIGKTNNLYMVVVQSLYLSHRVQCVAINNHHSDFLPCSAVRSTSRQYTWSFTIVNDLPLSVSSLNMVLFARLTLL